jgi:hypothetical protein
MTRLRDAAVERPLRGDPADLTGALLAYVKPGPVDGEGWSLLAANASVAAKLRQLKPRFEDMLRDAGWSMTSVRIKVSADGG